MEGNVIITLEKAREWYNSGNEALKEIALQAFIEKKLKPFTWKSIKTFEDAIDALNISETIVQDNISTITSIASVPFSRMMIAQYKLHIIKKALNGVDWKPTLNNGIIYYVGLKWYLKGYSYPVEYTKIGEFLDTYNDKYYNLVCNDSYYSSHNGLGNFYGGFVGAHGEYKADIGLLGCKSKEIAQHLCKYFGKIIFDAIYGQYNNYEWVYTSL